VPQAMDHIVGRRRLAAVAASLGRFPGRWTTIELTFHCRQEAAGTGGSRMMMMTSSLLGTMDEEDMSAEQQQCTMALKDGKRLLKDKQGSSAMVRLPKIWRAVSTFIDPGIWSAF